jgi:opacity protein-like surface antigen
VDPNLVLGLEFGYSRPSSLYSSSSNGTDSASYKLVDYGTFSGRAGYAFGQFLPYAELGLAVGRIDYTVSNPPESRDNAYALASSAVWVSTLRFCPTCSCAANGNMRILRRSSIPPAA